MVMRWSFWRWVLVVSSMGLSYAARGELFEVTLTVQESAGVNRHREPISGGIPLPQNRVPRDQAFALFAANGQEYPCQVSPLVVETDGTLRWILIDFQDDVAAGETKQYVLRATAPTVTASESLKVTETDEAVVVDTSAVQYAISKCKPFVLFDVVRIGSERVAHGDGVSYDQLQGRDGWSDDAKWKPRRLTAGPPDSVRVCYAGPLRATIEVAGKFTDDALGAGYKTWITAWQGKSCVWVKFKLCNSNPDQYTAVLVGRSAIELKLCSPTQTVLLGAVEPISAERQGWLHQGLYLHHTYQDISAAAKAGSGDEVRWVGDGPADRPAGWIAADGGGRVFVCDTLFSTNPARRLAVAENNLVLEGIAERFEGPRDAKFNRDRRDRPAVAIGGFLALRLLASFVRSTCSTSMLRQSPRALDRLARAARNRLWVLAPGEHYSQCEVLGTGQFGTLADEMASYRKWGWTWDDGAASRADAPDAGRFVAWEDNHYESEADSVQGLAADVPPHRPARLVRRGRGLGSLPHGPPGLADRRLAVEGRRNLVPPGRPAR